MKTLIHTVSVVCAATSIALAFPVPRQSSQMQDQDNQHARDDPGEGSARGVLGGPKVGDPKETLVHMNMAGEFVPIEGRPEIAALRLVDIHPVRREQAEQAAFDRIAALGMLLVDEIDLVKEATDAIRTGDQQTARKLQEAVYHKFDPEGLRDPLLSEFDGILTADELDDVRALVDEYWDAWIKWETRDLAEHTEAAKAQTQKRLEYTLYLPELVQAYNLALRPYRQRLDAIYALTDATPQQRSKIRDIIIEFIRDTRLEPNEEQRLAVARRIYELLDDNQRRKFFEQTFWRQ